MNKSETQLKLNAILRVLKDHPSGLTKIQITNYIIFNNAEYKVKLSYNEKTRKIYLPTLRSDIKKLIKAKAVTIVDYKKYAIIITNSWKFQA